jgi:hypothetical protein
MLGEIDHYADIQCSLYDFLLQFPFKKLEEIRMESFYNKISGVMEDLIIAIVALGILVVSFEYIQFYIDFKNQIPTIDFAQRILLFLAVVMFTAYYFVSYSAYFSNKNNHKSCANYSAGRMVIMYLLDLLGVTIASWLYAVLLIGVLTSTPDNLPEKVTEMNLQITLNDMNTLFTIMFLWHTTVTLWYFAAQGDKQDKRLHIMYVLAYFLLICCTAYCTDEFLVWLFIGIYIFLVLSIYYFKGIPDIKKAIESQRDMEC